MIETQRHTLAAESQFASGCICNALFARDFSEIWTPDLSVVKSLDWLVVFCRDYAKKYNDAPGIDILPYVEAAIRSCDLPEEAMAFFAQAAKNPPKNTEALLARAQKHYHLLSRQRHADRISAAIMADDEEGIEAADQELRAHKVGADKWPDEEDVTDKRGNAAMADSTPKPLFRLPGYAGVIMNKALTRDAFVVNVGTAKVGKSANGVRVGYAAACEGLHVWALTLGDDKVPRYRRRIFACHSGRPVLTEAEEPQCLPIVVCKRGAKGECKRCSGTCLSPFPAEKVFAETQPEELLAKYPDFVPCRDCWRNGRADHPDFEPLVWWIREEHNPLTLAQADEACDEMAGIFRGGSLKVTYRPKGVLSFQKLRDLYNRRADKNGYKDEVIIADYLEMMELPPGKDDYGQLRTLSEQIRNFSTEEDILFYTFLQANRLGGTIETHTMESVGRCKWVLDNCTAGFGINQTPLERAMGLTRINQMAGREFKFAPEHQAMCCSWLHVQDPFAESFHVYRKIKEAAR